MLKLLPEWLKIGGGAVFGALLVSYPAILVGRHEGRQQAATAALETSVRVLRERNQINDQVSASNAAALCSSYGLRDDEQAECVRRVSTVDPEP